MALNQNKLHVHQYRILRALDVHNPYTSYYRIYKRQCTKHMEAYSLRSLCNLVAFLHPIIRNFRIYN